TALRFLCLAEMLRQCCDWLGAKKAIVQAEKMYGDVVPIFVFLNMGFIDAQMGNFDDAISSMRRALAIEADNQTAIYALGSLLASRGNLREAEGIFSRDVPV